MVLHASPLTSKPRRTPLARSAGSLRGGPTPVSVCCCKAISIRTRLSPRSTASVAGAGILVGHNMAIYIGVAVGVRRKFGASAVCIEPVPGDPRLPDEADELRDRLLRGYRYILVDEYQDIDELQYRLVQLVMAAIERLRSLDPSCTWSDIAVLARTHRATRSGVCTTLG